MTPVEGMIATVMTRLDLSRTVDGTVVNATDPELLSEAENRGRRQGLEYAHHRVPGYEESPLLKLSTQKYIGVRETRRVHGDARLTRDDVLGARRFDDEVGLCGAPIEDHHPGAHTRWQYLPDGEVVGIPYGTLVVRDAVDTLVAGRCFSATYYAHASVRSMAQTMADGTGRRHGRRRGRGDRRLAPGCRPGSPCATDSAETVRSCKLEPTEA